MSAGGYPFRMYAEPAEDMRSIATGSFDAIFSNATLEHFYDLPAVARELYRVTKLNGLSRHQIDFRDHRDFSRPLEFLLDDDDGFELALKGNRWMQGNRLRPSEVIRVFYEAGFQLLEIQPNTTAEMAYLADFVPRLRAAKYTRYTAWPVGDLITTGARFIWRRPS
jgi:ubiquinone/menaquinone biosynthesis C-methylase UbiE